MRGGGQFVENSVVAQAGKVRGQSGRDNSLDGTTLPTSLHSFIFPDCAVLHPGYLASPRTAYA